MDFPPEDVLADLGIPMLTDEQLIEVVREANAEHKNNQITINGSVPGRVSIELFVET